MGYIRDLQGIKNKNNKQLRKHFLLRSASLDKPTKEQIDYLNSIKLKRIIDLRNEEEAMHEPDVKIDGCSYFNFSLIDEDLNGITHQAREKQLRMLQEVPTMEECYIGMFKDEFSLNNIKNAMREIVLNDGFPVDVHCATGKDRAGMIVMLLLYILDVDYETILDDYLKQRKMYLPTAIKYGVLAFIGSKGDRTLAKKAYDFFAVKKEFIDKAIETIISKFGSLDNFIYDYIGLTKEEVNNFKEKALI